MAKFCCENKEFMASCLKIGDKDLAYRIAIMILLLVKALNPLLCDKFK